VRRKGLRRQRGGTGRERQQESEEVMGGVRVWGYVPQNKPAMV